MELSLPPELTVILDNKAKQEGKDVETIIVEVLTSVAPSLSGPLDPILYRGLTRERAVLEIEVLKSSGLPKNEIFKRINTLNLHKSRFIR